jgi:glycopeptide antibiotics resistance protein
MILRSRALKEPISSEPGLSNRIFLLALAGILFLTLFPFRITLQGKLPPGSSPFLLGAGDKSDSAFNMFLNVLLFVPFGFGLSERLREKGWPWKQVFFVTWIAGTVTSYVIEFLQIYIPSRDAGWVDVVTNGSGAAIGSALFVFLGPPLVGHIVKFERKLRTSLTPRRAIVILSIYFALWFVVSALLQRQTHVAGWSPQSRLYLAGEPHIGAAPPWKGTVSELKLWSLAVSGENARALTRGDVPDTAKQGLIASYDFSSSSGIQDQMGLLPDLSWSPRPPPLAEARGLAFDGHSWLGSKAPISSAIQAFQQTNQFSVLISCTPAASSEDQRILSFVQPSGAADLLFRQEDANLVFWFRNPLSARHPLLAWSIPNIFFAGQPRSILLSYNGSNLVLYVDGRRDPHDYILGPGTRAAEFVHRIKSAELAGYEYIYDALIFFPAGALLGIAVMGENRGSVLDYISVALLYFLPPWIYDQILANLSHRPSSFMAELLCLAVAIAGSLWIDSDRSQKVALRL